MFAYLNCTKKGKQNDKNKILQTASTNKLPIYEQTLKYMNIKKHRHTRARTQTNAHPHSHTPVRASLKN